MCDNVCVIMCVCVCVWDRDGEDLVIFLSSCVKFPNSNLQRCMAAQGDWTGQARSPNSQTCTHTPLHKLRVQLQVSLAKERLFCNSAEKT